MSNDIANINAPVDTAIAGTAATIFSPDGLNQLMKFAEVMAQSRVTVPAHLAGNQLIAWPWQCRLRSGE